ncbi:enoyl-CoA hydratase/isomerase family protein [Stappia sp. P2PMeth1]|uniref:enoyl-CoA hydratase/isomerase family protein n=1 Tax=Stappia sp. P2PMeth1 TaxID=2003586 RepID=UPI0016458322|nr:enoyl-CoA hydratase/isomerase family protein [Stappia sp. P2PMeth1]
MSAPAPDGELLVRRQGRAGRITLNRPRALNLLSEAMLAGIASALQDWRADPALELVVIDAVGGRAFCAGGDIAAVHGRIARGDIEGARGHCLAEYRLDLALARYPKPVVTLIDGVAMGGGLGFALHASHPIASERASFAMPECGIGWIPDSGATHLLSSLPAPLAAFIALTGEKLTAEAAAALGFVRYRTASEQMPALAEALCEDGLAALPAALPAPLPASLTDCAAALPGFGPELEHAFAAPDVPEILVRLEKTGGEACARAAKALLKASPLALALTLEALARARRHGGLEAALGFEYEIISRLMVHADFSEGIRAAMIDRDRRPAWTHAATHRFSAAELAPFLPTAGAPLPPLGER